MNRFCIEEMADSCYQDFPASERPVIGITANYGELTAKVAEGYYKQVERAGGTPIIIPPLPPSLDRGTLAGQESSLLTTLSRIDALLLTGGADINPLFQGEEPLPQLGGINAERDLPELLITRLAFNRQLPILGICRGIQTMAVALGGKVAQDIASQHPQQSQQPCPLIKHSQDADRHVPTHTIAISPGSLLQAIFTPGFSVSSGTAAAPASPATSTAVNSFHHQAVSDPGPHFRVSATAPDGIIEAIENAEHKPVLGVQWHPECMGDDGLPLFRWLVSEARLYRQTQRLHDRILTLDTHCDTPMFFPQGIHFASRDKRILVDLPKMTEGRLDATIMVAYIPQKMQESAYDYANAIFDKIETIVGDNAARLALARTPDELWANKLAGKKSIVLGIENGKALEGQLSHISHFAQRGVVYITLCHNGDNDICDSAALIPQPSAPSPAQGSNGHLHQGVSPFGVEVIHEMNRLGLMVDLSHAHEKSFYDALDISATPIVCSHSSCRALCDHPRNLTDDQMRALAKKGGVCQITVYPGFLRTDSQATILDVMAHLDHAVQVMGIDHVGLGTDFDGDGGVPGLADASELLNFTRQLLQRRYNDDDIQKIWGGNFLRVMKQVQSTRNND
jgi:microsomal dipeptidase-like Zn-dependent dipeptidase/gamma-glutamyl-gamma-aminobutyrate hydrolase PuuD